MMKREISVVSMAVVMFAMMGADPVLADLDITLTGASGVSDGRCEFDFEVTNLKGSPLGEFYVDVEDGLTSAQANMEAIAPPGWTAAFCYPHDNVGWAIICYMADPGNEIPVAGMLDGFGIKTNVSAVPFPAGGDNKPIDANCIHITWTNDTPIGLGVDCSTGNFGPHEADGGDWDPLRPGASPGDHLNGGTEWCWEAPPIPTVSEWGLIVMTLLLLTAGTIALGRRRRAVAA